ncbi:MAG TPA: hypothetical protein VLK79_16615 [Gaiellales bacterium]|nr:hypothetical protein [Gaiellales bacterium]
MDVCTEDWLHLTLLYWTEAPGNDPDRMFCSYCGHTFGCHLRARGEVLDANGHPVPAEATA